MGKTFEYVAQLDGLVILIWRVILVPQLLTALLDRIRRGTARTQHAPRPRLVGDREPHG